MKLRNREVQTVDVYQAITWAATFAVKEAIVAGHISENDATELILRMNAIVSWLGDNKIVMFNKKTGLFEPHDVGEATEREGVTDDPDVLVINGE